MGLGDWIMASADVRRAHEKWGVRCMLGDGNRAFWSEVFENNPKVARPGTLNPDEKFAWVPNYPTNRPYLLGADSERFYYNPDFKAAPGELFLSDLETREGSYILIEPHTKKDMCGPNKRWPFERWRAVAKRFRDYPLAQMSPDANGLIKGVKHLRTPRFRDTLGYLKSAKLLITTDGALHHAAAALGVPAVVIWGGVASPKNLGYDTHINLYHGAEPCGTHSTECPHCKAALERVTVEEVVSAIEDSLERR